jgi:hypothetical protein
VKQHVSLLAVILAISVTVAAIAQSRNCSIRDLPKGIADIIGSKYAGWRLEQISDLGPDDHELWAKVHGDTCPGIAIGHFQSNDRVTYAVLLLKTNAPDQAYKFLLFNEDRSGTFGSILVGHAEGKNAGQPVISRVPPGEYSDPETGQSVKTKLDSVLIEWIEAAAQLYYWSGSKYHKLQVQD